MEKQDIINYVLTTPENTNPAILEGMLEQLIAQSGGGGGGGESDFSTANVTVKYDDEPASNTTIIAPNYYDTEGYIFAMGNIEISSNSDTSAKIILYKGTAIISTDDIHKFDAEHSSGDIEIDEEDAKIAVVTGDSIVTVVPGTSV